MSEKGNSNFFVGALIGTLAGALAGVLFAPRSGKETRKMISERAKDYADKGKKIVVEKEREAKEAISKVAEKISK